MSRRLADLATTSGREWSQEHFRTRASDADHSAELLRSVLRRESEQPTAPSGVTGT